MNNSSFILHNCQIIQVKIQMLCDSLPNKWGMDTTHVFLQETYLVWSGRKLNDLQWATNTQRQMRSYWITANNKYYIQ